MKDYSNKELAQYYYSLICMTNASTKLDGFRRNRDTIASFETKISEYYQKHESLNSLNLKGIGNKSKNLLELILENGYEMTLRIKVNLPDVNY